MKTFSVEPIGVIRSELKNIEDAPLFCTDGAPNALLEVFPAYLEGLDQMQASDEIIVITWLHCGRREVLSVTRSSESLEASASEGVGDKSRSCAYGSNRGNRWNSGDRHKARGWIKGITDLPTRLQPTKGGEQVFVQPLSISGIAERPTGEGTIPPNQQNETKQCDSWL